MNDPVFELKQDDMWPPIRVAIKDSDGNPIDLSGGVITFVMRLFGSTGAYKVNAQAVVVEPAMDGLTEYQWVSGDTDTPGLYQAEFQVYFRDNNWTAPNGNHLLVRINPHA